MDDEAYAIYRMSDDEVENRLAQLFAENDIKAYREISQRQDGEDFEYAEEIIKSEISKIASTDKRAIRKPESKEKSYKVHPEAKSSKAGDRTHKRIHEDGVEKDPYTKMEDDKPLGSDEGKMPQEMRGLRKKPENHDELVEQGYSNLNYEYKEGEFAEDYSNFCDAKPLILKPGTKIYRIVDENSADSGAYWAYDLPRNKAEWRKNYAVKDSWNDNGYYVEHIVGEEGLKVWSGTTAGQPYEKHGDDDFHLKGGNEQIFITPGSISTSKPKLTNWPEA